MGETEKSRQKEIETTWGEIVYDYELIWFLFERNENEWLS